MILFIYRINIINPKIIKQISLLLQMADEPKRDRNRRNIQRPNRSDIYCYDNPIQDIEGKNSQQIDDDDIKSDDIPNDDDSSSYNGPTIRKIQNKKRQTKQKNSKQIIVKKNNRKTNEVKEKIKKENIPGVNYVEYFASSKQQKDIKIFNPVVHLQNKALKQKYQKELENIYSEYGRKIGKSQEPPNPPNSWNYLLKQVEEAGKDFMSERQERIKLKRKISKFAQSFCNRKEQIKEQRIRDEQKQVKRQSLELMRLVKRKFWGSAVKVRKIVLQQQRKKIEKQSKMKKLQDLVARQFEASQKITKVLEGYQEVSLENIQVSQTTKVPVIINIDRKPKYKFSGLHEDNTIRPSLLVKFPLRQYQLLGVYWIYTLHNRGMNAILADEMGLGKTIQTIGLLAHLAMEKGIWGPHLVIVPTTILMNWEIQFKRWCPAFKIMTYFGSPKQRKIKRKGWSKLNTFHVCITSYKIAVTDNPIFRRKKWYYMVLDEAQNIKNFKSQRWQILLNFKTRHRLLLTGTPLQNDLTQLWSLLHFLMPKIFNSFDDFNEWFNIPFQQALEKNFPISQQILKKLHTVLRPFFLRRLKKDVETQLPKKTQSIVRCGMSRRQKYLYDQMIWHQNKRNKNHESAGIMNVLMGLKKICNHPDLFQPRIQQTPLNWSPFTVVIAHHMFLKVHFQTYKTHVLRDFVDNFTTEFKVIANQILKQYSKIQINEQNQQYYKYKYYDRLAFAKVNYQRSKRKQFEVYPFSFNKLEMLSEKVPYYMTKSISDRATEFQPIFDRFVFVVPKVMAAPSTLTTFPMNSQVQAERNRLQYLRSWARKAIPIDLERIRTRFLLHFPNKSIILYDSGKLIKLILLLKSIKYRGHKALVFTQMTKMLDIFEKVLNMFKFNYVRLDGNTKTELRQTIVERFNNDPRILCFISSTRSGGIGLNLTGASNVIFYDTDWNPAMDKQAQDRCHRIGQTRDVTIYRLITQYSIQQNILIKSIHKRKLETLVTQQGMFDTSYFQKVNLKGLLQGAIDYQGNEQQQGDLAEVEDQEDRQLLEQAQKNDNQGNKQKDDEQQELEVEMLPKLFKYGLNMLQNRQAENQVLSDSESGQNMQEQNQQQSQENIEQIQQEQESKQPKQKIEHIKNKAVQRQMRSKNNIKSVDDQNSEKSSENKQDISGIKRDRKGNKISQGNDDKQEIFEQSEEMNNKNQNKKKEQGMEEEQQSQQQIQQIQTVYQPQIATKMSTLDKLKAMATYQSQYMYMKKHFYEIQEQKQVQQQQNPQILPPNQKSATVTKPKNSRSHKKRTRR